MSAVIAWARLSLLALSPADQHRPLLLGRVDGITRAKRDPSQVGDALLNLTINTRDAMPLGGRIQISTGNVHLEHDLRDPMVAPRDT